MSGTPVYPVTQALADLIQAAQDRPTSADRPDEAVLTLVDLSGIASRIGDLADQLRMLHAGRPAVVEHLQRARIEADELRRTLDHAAGALAHSTGLADAELNPRPVHLGPVRIESDGANQTGQLVCEVRADAGDPGRQIRQPLTALGQAPTLAGDASGRPR